MNTDIHKYAKYSVCLNIGMIINIWKKYFTPENGKAFCSKDSENKFSLHRDYPLGLCHKREERIFKKYKVVLLAYSCFVLRQSELRMHSSGLEV